MIQVQLLVLINKVVAAGARKNDEDAGIVSYHVKYFYSL